LARRVDGAFPKSINPIAVSEIKRILLHNHVRQSGAACGRYKKELVEAGGVELFAGIENTQLADFATAPIAGFASFAR